MHAPTMPEHVAWVEECVGDLLADLRMLTGHLRALAARSPAVRGAEGGAADQFRMQATLVRWECATLRRQLVQLRETGQLDEEGAGRLEPSQRPS